MVELWESFLKQNTMNMNRSQQQLYHDVHRIAESLREIVKLLKNEEKISDKDCWIQQSMEQESLVP